MSGKLRKEKRSAAEGVSPAELLGREEERAKDGAPPKEEKKAFKRALYLSALAEWYAVNASGSRPP